MGILQHGTNLVQQGAVEALGRAVLLRAVANGGLQHDALRCTEGLQLLVDVLGAVVAAQPPHAGAALSLQLGDGCLDGRGRLGLVCQGVHGGGLGVKVKVKVGKSLHRLNFPVLTSSFRPLFDLPDAPSAVPPTSSEWVPGRPVPKPWRF